MARDQLDCADRIHTAVRVHHVARLRRRPVAQGRSRSAARMGTRRAALRYRGDLVLGGRGYLHRVHVHRRSRTGLRHRRYRVLRGSVHHSSFIRCCFSYSPDSGTCVTSMATSPRPISSAAAMATGGSRSPITITGIVATLPYIALQLVGIQVVVGALGVTGSWHCRRSAAGHRFRRARRFHVFQRTPRPRLDRHRQGHPDLYCDLRHHHRRAA